MTAIVDGTNGLIQQYDYQTPTTGFSYTFAAGVTVLLMNPAGTLATGTITMPATPADGMTITFNSTRQITNLTLNGNTGQTVVSKVTTLPANYSTTYVYRLSNTTWYPLSTVAGSMADGTQLYRLDSAFAGSNATGAQSIFGVGVTLLASTVYEFEGLAILLKSAGTTSHTLSTLFGGTATLNNIGYGVLGYDNVGLGARATAEAVSSIVATAVVLTGALTSASQGVMLYLKGTVSINAGGTFIPQYTLSVAPGGAYSTQAGSYMKIYPIGASGAATNVGSWA
jgi:hypothetical protein